MQHSHRHSRPSAITLRRPAQGFGQFHLALPLGQLGFLFRAALVVAVGAAHAFDVVR